LSILVIGLGNILLTDEGIGVHVVNTMKERYTFSPEPEILDGGTLGLDLLHFLEGKDKILLIDAVDFRKEPAHIGVLEDDNIPSQLFTKLSVHHIGLSDLLFAAKLLDMKPSKIRLIGIQPQSLELGLTMTEPIRAIMEDVIDLAVKSLEEWKVACVLRSPQKLSA